MSAVLFDMDGVLLFSEDAWFLVYNETLRHFGYPEIGRAAFDAIYGNGTEADRDTYMPRQTIEEVDGAYRHFFPHHVAAVRVNPEAAPALAALRDAGVPTAVATNTSRPLADELLARAGLRALLTTVASADEAGAGKPDPAVVRLAAARLGAELADCVFVGDSRYDEEAAAAAPVSFLGYRFGRGARVESLLEVESLLPPVRSAAARQ